MGFLATSNEKGLMFYYLEKIFMKIYRIAKPMPLEEIPMTHGDIMVDGMSEELARQLEQNYCLRSHIGGGSFGSAYLTCDGNILKITTDVSEFKVAKELQNLPHYAFAKVFDAEALKSENGTVFYIIKKERVSPLTEHQAMIYDTVLFVYGQNSGIDGDDIEEMIENGDLQELSWDNEEKEFAKKVVEFIGDAEELSINRGFVDILRNDNVGINNEGDLVAFDYQYKPWGP